MAVYGSLQWSGLSIAGFDGTDGLYGFGATHVRLNFQVSTKLDKAHVRGQKTCLNDYLTKEPDSKVAHEQEVMTNDDAEWALTMTSCASPLLVGFKPLLGMSWCELCATNPWLYLGLEDLVVARQSLRLQ